jgi:apurinic endonuclease APN1
VEIKYLGVHTSTSKDNQDLGEYSGKVQSGIAGTLIHSENRGFNCLQICPTSPIRWVYESFKDGYLDEFNTLLNESEIESVLFHGVYLSNLASKKESTIKLGKKSLISYLDLIGKVQLDQKLCGVVFHVGTLKDWDDAEADTNLAFEQVRDAINEILEQSDPSTQLLLENSAGAGRVIGSSLKDLRRIYDSLDSKYSSRVGYCLDTQHMWASGYELREKSDTEERKTKVTPKTSSLNETLSEIEQVLGTDKVKYIHLNESATEFSSGVDRHANLGEGKIGTKSLAKFLESFKSTPTVLETPDHMTLDRSAVLERLS